MSWILLALLATGCMYLMRWTDEAVDAVLLRVAAGLYLAAGVVLAAGWLGTATTAVAHAATAVCSAVGAAALADVVGWTVVAALAGYWTAALVVPDDKLALPVPDSLVLAGLVLPALLAAAPGPIGHAMATLTEQTGDGVDALLMALVR